MAIPDLNHELFLPFQRGGAQEFSGVRWRSLFGVEKKIVEGATILLSLENGAPFYWSAKSAKVVCCCLGPVDYAWSNFPFQSIFALGAQRSVRYPGWRLFFGRKESFR